MKFNVVSIREVYKKLTDTFNLTNKLITQMYWRDFYMQIMFHHNVIRMPFREKYKDIEWDNNPSYIKKWKEGQTGIPIIDAAMRQCLPQRRHREPEFLYHLAKLKYW